MEDILALFVWGSESTTSRLNVPTMDMLSQYVSWLKSTSMLWVWKLEDPQSTQSAISCHAALTCPTCIHNAINMDRNTDDHLGRGNLRWRVADDNSMDSSLSLS